ncbi:biopolymer transport protein ExbD/TolR [Filimonas lacunae]|nr:biopolymer transport protein ExbD/TolR [Filimonas lacunae]
MDLTPMVDLGFLLITFFIFTTTMSSPTAMKLNLPKDAPEKDQNKAKESGALTVMLGKDNNVFYYEGILDPAGANFKSSNFKDIRDVIINKKKSTPADDFVVVIKPTDESKYKNVIDMLDEMAINEVKRYAMVDISEGELQLIKVSEGESPTAAPATK